MAQVTGQKNIERKEITYFDGVNSLMSSNVAKKEEIPHAENARSPMVGTIEKREGISVLGTGTTAYADDNEGLFYFGDVLNSGNGALYKLSRISGVLTLYYLNTTNNTWTALPGLGVGMGTPQGNFMLSTCIANGKLYMADYNNNTQYILGSDGTTIVDSSTITGNLYRCPKANLINHYKDRLYVANYRDSGGVQQKNGVLMSSTPLGILALVNNDVKANLTKIIPVTDNKYFIPGETVQFYRGTTLRYTGVIDTVQETTITLTAVSTVDLLAADEIWVNNTFGGAGVEKVFRWVANPASMGVNAKEYDTFRITGTVDNSSEAINVMENVGNFMLFFTNNNLVAWNGYVLQNLDLGVGCVSPQGWVKNSGTLYFLHYTGIYETAGAMPKYLSSKVERYIAGATRAGLESACAGKKGRNIFFAIGDVTLRNPDGSIEKTLQDVCLEYSITQENWYVHTNWKLLQMATYYSSSDPDVLTGLSTYSVTGTVGDPVVKLLDSGVYTDLNSEIPFRADTQNIMLGNTFQNVAYPQEVHLELERGSGVKCFVSLDWGDWYELDGEANKGATIFKVNSKNKDVAQPPRCRNIRLSFRHIGKQLCKVSKAAILYIVTPEEEMSSDNDPGYINSTQ